MMGKFLKWVDLLAAVFLMFLFPAVCLHVKLRDGLFEACAQRVREYGEMFQKQGYLSLEAARELLSGEDGLLGAVTLAVWQEERGQEKLLAVLQLEAEAWDYMGTGVYPLSDGDGLLFVLRMPPDGFERAYYYFCGEAPQREYVCFFPVRDGLKERKREGAGGESEIIPLFDTFYDSVFGDCHDAVCKRANSSAAGGRAAEDGAQRGLGSGRGSRIFGDLQRRKASD